VDRVIFAADLIAYAFVGVSLSNLRDLLRFVVVSLLVFALLFTAQKKAHLKPDTRLFCLLWK